MHRPQSNRARNLHLGGIRRNTCTQSRRLTTRRSQVQILPPLLRRAPETAPFAYGRWRELSTTAYQIVELSFAVRHVAHRAAAGSGSAPVGAARSRNRGDRPGNVPRDDGSEQPTCEMPGFSARRRAPEVRFVRSRPPPCRSLVGHRLRQAARGARSLAMEALCERCRQSCRGPSRAHTYRKPTRPDYARAFGRRGDGRGGRANTRPPRLLRPSSTGWK
jgi:hypothetical protein